ncbi:ABC transporter permease subunit [Streptomyces sp. NPDC006997]|uniref:ABC transporter permease subunit n=1 Tax=Streptomyces sp. NPDC006997 TaxID=3155356 RepID=UPI0033E73F9F
MSSAILVKYLSDSRRALTGWAVGTAAVATVYASTYPSQRENTANLPEALREGLHIDQTAAGYLHASVFGVLLPLLAMIYGVTAGTRAIAAEEEAGQLDMVLAHPVTRTQLAAERFAALVAGAFAIAALVWLGLLAIRNGSELTSVTPVEFLAQCLNLALLAVLFGALAIGLGGIVGRRSVVLVSCAVIGVVSYTLDTFAGQLDADWLAYVSPFHYYIGGEPLRHGFQWADALVLVVASGVLFVLGVRRFNQRDINS